MNELVILTLAYWLSAFVRHQVWGGGDLWRVMWRTAAFWGVWQVVTWLL